MAATIALALISVGAVAFLILFLIALSEESRSGACHIVRILRDPGEQGGRSGTAPVREMPRRSRAFRGVGLAK